MKVLKWLGVAVTIFLITLACIWVALPSWISNKLSSEFATPVKIKTIRLFSKGFKVHGIFITSPDPYRTFDYALAIDEVDIQVNILDLFKKESVIQEIMIKNLYFGLEWEAPGSLVSNWTLLLNNLNQDPANGRAIAKNSKSNRSSSKTIMIKKLILQQPKMEVGYLRGNYATKKIDMGKSITMRNLTSQGGGLSRELFALMVKQIALKMLTEKNITGLFEKFLHKSNHQIFIKHAVKPLP